MTRKSSFVSCGRAAFFLLALFALTFSIVVPRGYMVARANDGVARILICSGDGPATIALPKEFRDRLSGNDHQEDDRQDHAGKACPYVGNAAPFSAPDSYAIAEPSSDFGPLLATLPWACVDPGRGMAAPPPPSQAPPIATI
ncbi:MAG: hypothetical protein R3E04_03170 [Sphingobium sp.]